MNQRQAKKAVPRKPTRAETASPLPDLVLGVDGNFYIRADLVKPGDRQGRRALHLLQVTRLEHREIMGELPDVVLNLMSGFNDKRAMRRHARWRRDPDRWTRMD
jgi:hypothetical protein